MFGLMGMYCVMIANAIYAVLRTSSPLVNHSIMLLILLIPLVLLVLAVAIKPTWLKTIVIVGILPLLFLSALSGFFAAIELSHIWTTGQDQSFVPITSVKLQSSRVVVYRTDGGATTSFGIVARHERVLFPGILLVRNIYHVYPGSEAQLTIIDPTTIKIVSPPYDSERRPKPDEAVIRLKPWVYL